MKFKVKTKVNANFQKVFDHFDLDLFLKLNPPFLSVNVLKFDGVKQNAEMELQLPLKQKWIAKITSLEKLENEIFFIDEGLILPFPLKYWKHKHIFTKISEKQTVIEDNIEFNTGNLLFNVLSFPFFYLLMLNRVPKYKQLFNKI